MDLYPIILPPIQLVVAVGLVGGTAFIIGQELGDRIAARLGLA